MKTKYFWVIIIFICSGLNLKGQKPDLEKDTIQNKSTLATEISMPQIIPGSPKASSILKYGEYPVSLHTGLVDITIPIYTIEEKGIKVPIEFKYHASGIKYDDVSLEVGLGWSLIAGGTVEYSVRGSEDYPTNFSEKSFIKNIEDIVPSGNCDTNGDVYKMFSIINGNKLYPTSEFEVKDGESDIYNYSFLQYSGQYCIPHHNSGPNTGPSGAIFIPANPLRLASWGNPELIDGKGIHYVFEQMELDDYGRHKTFYLTKIITADKTDSIVFNYTKYPPAFGYEILRPQIDGMITTTASNFLMSVQRIPSGGLRARSYYPPRLNSIDFQGGRVVFEYYNNVSTSRDLRTVKIYNKIESDPIQTISLVKGQFAGNRGDRLDQVVFQNSQGDSYDYQFGYNGNPGTNANPRIGVDYWGYYNNKVVNGYDYLPDFTYTDLGYGSPLGTLDRSANEIAMRQGVLNKIIYPTKGYTEFSYEAHKALNKTYGGLRIKEIRNYANSGVLAEKKWYEYGENESGEGRAAAYPKLEDFVTETRVLETYIENDTGPFFVGAGFIRQYSAFPKRSYFSSGSSVIYTQVTEYVGNDGNDIGKTIYKFEDFPDQHVITGETVDIETADYGSVDMPMRTYSWKTGMLKSKEIFKKENGIYTSISSLTNNYKDIRTAEYENLRVLPFISLSGYNREQGYYTEDSQALYCFDQVYPLYSAFREHFNRGVPFNYFNYYITTGLRVLESSTQVENGVSTQTYYDEYNDYGFPKTVRSVLSTGDNKTIRYKYPSDLSTTSIYGNMTNKNILSPVIEVTEYKDSNTFLREKVNVYSNPRDGQFLLSSVQTKQGDQATETRMDYSYNSKGDITQVTKDNAEKVVYLWGYNNQYPIAKIENASYPDVCKAVGNGNESTGKSTLEAITSKAQPNAADFTTINNLRTQLPNALITTYIYKPLVGITSQTNPRGIKTSYDYDAFGQLLYIKDENNNIIESYDYRYRNP